MNPDKETLPLLNQLRKLEQEHQELNLLISSPEVQRNPDQLFLQRLKKRKLTLKDKISKLKNLLYPDIIA